MMSAAERHKRWRSTEAGKAAMAAGRVRFRARRQAAIRHAKMERGCTDCGYNEHACALQFDHLPGTEKLFGLADTRGRSWETLEAEMAKCDVVCANCHAVRTEARRLALA